LLCMTRTSWNAATGKAEIILASPLPVGRLSVGAALAVSTQTKQKL
jgi:hypothetical protein